MKKSIIILAIIAILIASILLYMKHLGCFKKYKVEEKSMDEMMIVYGEFTGDYKKMSKDMMKLHDWLAEGYDLKGLDGIGIYFDNPEITPAKERRSVYGYILSEEQARLINLRDQKYRMQFLPRSEGISVEVPYKNPMSFFVAVIKGYPKLGEYMIENEVKPSPSIELYTKDEVIIYIPTTFNEGVIESMFLKSN